MVVREFRHPIKIILFISSYVPLFIIMGLKFWNVGPMLTDIYTVPYVDIHVGLSYLAATILPSV